jgi:hypothetical protein
MTPKVASTASAAAVEGEAPFDEEITILAARPGQRCPICRTPIREGDRVRISADTSDGPLLVRHVGWLCEGQDA